MGCADCAAGVVVRVQPGRSHEPRRQRADEPAVVKHHERWVELEFELSSRHRLGRTHERQRW